MLSADRKIAILGIMQAFFESSMYVFVFLWTPALSPHGERIPHGFVFSCFMTACMAGSACTGWLRQAFRVEEFMVWLYILSTASFLVPCFFHLELNKAQLGEDNESHIPTL
jgi:hypothetical protein